MKIKKFIYKSLLTLILTQAAGAQFLDSTASPASAKLNRERGLNMLSEIKEIIKDRYYDKNFRGIDLDARFKIASERIKKMDTNAQIFRVIAQVVLEFNDSHTRFIPPGRANRVEYGFSMQIIGNNCFVVDVKKGSDAEAKGLKVGDVVAGIGNFAPTRENLWKMNYLLYALDPQQNIKIFVQNPDKTEREIDIKARFKSIEEREKEANKRKNEKRENPYSCKQIDTETIACKLKTFSIDKKYVDKMMKEVGVHKKFILDLRGNGGGYVKIEEYLTGYFFDRNVKIADFVMRQKIKERTAKPLKDKTYKGELVVLIDSNSASASEVFARVVQLEKRGKVVGDVSAGAVMTSISLGMANVRGPESLLTFSVYGISVTIADLIMADGKRLENAGVIPDYLVGPTGTALFAKTDPVLSYAASLFGAKISAEEAGQFYFITSKPEGEDDDDEDVTVAEDN
ncbi:MAG: S41 family peptidase [Pyrinomonadaceae bacterium]